MEGIPPPEPITPALVPYEYGTAISPTPKSSPSRVAVFFDLLFKGLSMLALWLIVIFLGLIFSKLNQFSDEEYALRVKHDYASSTGTQRITISEWLDTGTLPISIPGSFRPFEVRILD